MKPFCEQLAEARKIKGITQEELATEMNITRQGVIRWENGRTLPDIETIKRLSQLLSYDFIAIEAPDECKSEESSDETSEEIVSEAPLSVPPRKNSCILYCSMTLVVGLIVGCLFGYYLLPRTQPSTPAPVNTITSSQKPVPYTPEVEGEAFLRITAAHNPPNAVRSAENSVTWIYTFTIKNVGELSFTADKIEQYVITDDGESLSLSSYTPQEAYWGEGVILPGCEQTFGGGFPIQPMKSVHIIVSGTDSNGKALSFEGEVELLKETAE